MSDVKPNIMSKEDGRVLARELQERLVQCCIDFIREKHDCNIERVGFTADALQISARHGKWTPATDSTCTLEGYDEKYGFFDFGFSA